MISLKCEISKFYFVIQLLICSLLHLFTYFGDIILWIIHETRKALNCLLIHFIESLRNLSQLSDLICNIIKNFLWHFIVLKQMKPLHGAVSLKVSSECSIDRFLHYHRWIFRMQLPCQCPSCSAGITSVVEIGTFIPFITG